MAYHELIKSFQKIRDYMREFYVYGFKTREEYAQKSARTYDNERRRIESWIGDCMSFRQDPCGKNVFLSIDSRRILHNPLYHAFKAKSFTAKDITLHFYLLDALAEGQALTARQLTDRIAQDYLTHFEHPFSIDESTVRKKLREYEALGLLTHIRQGKTVCYQRTDNAPIHLDSWADALAFFSEETPLGVIGSFLLDRLDAAPDRFQFKHHYMLHALDSEILYPLLEAIQTHRAVLLMLTGLRSGTPYQRTICPLRIYSSTQTGRQYILGYHYRSRNLAFYRLDAIQTVQLGNPEARYAQYEAFQRHLDKHLWGVSLGAHHHLDPVEQLDHIEMTIHAAPQEAHIVQRLEREKRHGTVKQLDSHTYQFTADVYDAVEMLPWIRTFIGRIVHLQCSNSQVTARFQQDLAEMLLLYGGNPHAVQ